MLHALLVKMPGNRTLHQVVPLIVAHRLLRLRSFLDVQLAPVENHVAFLENAQGSFFGCEVDEAPRRSVSVDQSDETPLREKIAYLLFTIPVADATHEDLARIGLTKH